jgi:hypothetical protein
LKLKTNFPEEEIVDLLKEDHALFVYTVVFGF